MKSIAQFPSNQWVEFEETQLHPLAEHMDYYGTMMPIQNATLEECFVARQVWGDDFYVDRAGDVQAISHLWQVYYNYDPDNYESGATVEEAANKMKIKLFSIRPRCHDWRVVSSEAYQRQLLAR